jgi:hypothetical protein
MDRTLLMQSSEMTKNPSKDSESEYQLTLVKFIEQPFTKANKAIGLTQ